MPPTREVPKTIINYLNLKSDGHKSKNAESSHDVGKESLSCCYFVMQEHLQHL
jgi:hypothetical protein